jgi:hypothetical protein
MPMLHEIAVLQLVIERCAPVDQVGGLDDACELGSRAFNISDTHRLAETVPRAGAPFHREHPNRLKLVLAAHRGDRIVGKPALGWRGRTGGYGNHHHGGEIPAMRHRVQHWE